MLTARRLVAHLAPRVRDRWPVILAIALAVVLAHSGFSHLREPADVARHYRDVLGIDLARAVGIAQLLAAGGLCFRSTRVMTCAAFAAVLVITIAGHLVTGRAGVATLTTGLVLAWTVAIAWGESHKAP